MGTRSDDVIEDARSSGELVVRTFPTASARQRKLSRGGTHPAVSQRSARRPDICESTAPTVTIARHDKRQSIYSLETSLDPKKWGGNLWTSTLVFHSTLSERVPDMTFA